MLPILNIGPLAIQTPGLLLLAGIWLGFSLMEKYYSRFEVQPAVVNNLVMYGLIGTVIGGRISYVAEHFSAFTKAPASLISLNPALWDPAGGILIGLVVSTMYGIRRKVQFWRLLDALTPGIAVVMVTIPLMDLASGNAYGEPARLPWSIHLWGAWRHPTQIYTALGSLLVLLLFLLLLKEKSSQGSRYRSGTLFLKFIVWSSTVQILAGAFRGDGQLIASLVRSNQVVAWLILAVSLALLGRRNEKSWQAVVPEQSEGNIP